MAFRYITDFAAVQRNFFSATKPTFQRLGEERNSTKETPSLARSLLATFAYAALGLPLTVTHSMYAGAQGGREGGRERISGVAYTAALAARPSLLLSSLCQFARCESLVRCALLSQSVSQMSAETRGASTHLVEIPTAGGRDQILCPSSRDPFSMHLQ